MVQVKKGERFIKKYILPLITLLLGMSIASIQRDSLIKEETKKEIMEIKADMKATKNQLTSNSISDENITKILENYVYDNTGLQLVFQEDISSSEMKKNWGFSEDVELGVTPANQHKYLTFQKSKIFPFDPEKIVLFSNAKSEHEKSFFAIQISNFYANKRVHNIPKDLGNYYEYWNKVISLQGNDFHYSELSGIRIMQVIKLFLYFRINAKPPAENDQTLQKYIRDFINKKKSLAQEKMIIYQKSLEDKQNFRDLAQDNIEKIFLYSVLGIMVLYYFYDNKKAKRKIAILYRINMLVYLLLLGTISFLLISYIHWQSSYNKVSEKIEANLEHNKSMSETLVQINVEIKEKKAKAKGKFFFSAIDIKRLIEEFFEKETSFTLSFRDIKQKNLKKQYINNISNLKIEVPVTTSREDNEKITNENFVDKVILPLILLDGRAYYPKNHFEIIYIIELKEYKIRINDLFWAGKKISDEQFEYLSSSDFNEYMKYHTDISISFIKEKKDRVRINAIIKIIEKFFQKEKKKLIENFIFFLTTEKNKNFSTMLLAKQKKDIQKTIELNNDKISLFQTEQKKLQETRNFWLMYLCLALGGIIIQIFFIHPNKFVIAKKRKKKNLKKLQKNNIDDNEEEEDDDGDGDDPESKGDGSASMDKAKEIVEEITNNFTLILPQDKKIITEKLLEINKAGYSATKFLSEVKKLKKVFDKAVGEKKKKDRIEKMKRDLKEKRKNF